MNLPKSEFIAHIYILYYQSSINFPFSPNLAGIPELNVMVIRVQRHANISKQATLLGGLDVSPLKWRVFGCGLNRFVHEGMNHISNVEVHLKTRCGNVNIC